MKKFLLDTDAVSFFYDASRLPEHSRIKSRVSALHDEDVLQVSVLTLYEFEYSYFNADNKYGIIDNEHFLVVRNTGITTLYKYKNRDTKNYLNEYMEKFVLEYEKKGRKGSFHTYGMYFWPFSQGAEFSKEVFAIRERES